MWTEERSDRVRHLWEAGQLSAAEIAERIGGTSRSAVIALTKRRGWEGGSQPPNARGGGRRACYDREAILNRWERGESETMIGRAVGASPRSISRIICEERKRGDKRAAHHGRFYYAGPRKPRQDKMNDISAIASGKRDRGGGLYHRIEKRRRAKRLVNAFADAATVAMDALEPASLNLTVMTLGPGQCRWPHGDGPILFCGAPAGGEKSYCPYHCGIAYRPDESRRRVKSQALYVREPVHSL